MYFAIGIAVRTREQLEEIHNLIINNYPNAKSTDIKYRSRSAYSTIKLPFLRITIFLMNTHGAQRYNVIYAPTDCTETEIWEYLMPMIIIAPNFKYLRSLDEIYKEFSLEDNNVTFWSWNLCSYTKRNG